MRDCFKNLEYPREIHDDEKTGIVDTIYSKVYGVFTHKERKMNPYEFIEIKDCEFSSMKEFLLSTEYYVLHHDTVQKGKQIFKKGRLVVVNKEAILTFFQKECQHQEEAMFFIMPKDLSKGQIFLNTEDWNFYAIGF